MKLLHFFDFTRNKVYKISLKMLLISLMQIHM